MRMITILLLTCLYSSAWAQRASIAVDKMNILYKEIENPITVMVEDCNCDEIELEGDKLKMKFVGATANNSCEYLVSPTEYGKTTLNVYNKKGGARKLIFSQDYRIKMIPEPELYLAGKQKGIITKDNLLAQKVFDVQLECSLMGRFKVTKVDVIFDLKSANQVIRKTFYSKKLNFEFKDIVQKMKTGDEVYFLNVSVKGVRINNRLDKERELNSALRLTIKE